MIPPQLPSLQATTASTEISSSGIQQSTSSEAILSMRPSSLPPAASFVEHSVARARAQSQSILQERKVEIDLYALQLTVAAHLTLDVKCGALKKNIRENKQLTPDQKTLLLNQVDEMAKAKASRFDKALQKAKSHPIYASSANVLPQELKAHIKQLQDDLKALQNSALGDIESLDQELYEEALKLGVETGVAESLMAPDVIASKVYRRTRLTQLHDPDAWSVGKWRDLSLRFRPGDTPSLSSFQAAGDPYSSAAARDRTPADNPVLPNFHHTAYTVEGQRVFQATRSATFSEFGSQEKEAVTQSLVGQMLKVHAEARIAGMSTDERKNNSRQNPLVLSHQTIGLFTPDTARDWGDKVFHRVPASDNEKEILSDTLKAHQHWNGKVVQINGVWVKCDVHLWNIPNNKLAEKMPGILMSEPEANKESWHKMNVAFQAEKKRVLEQVVSKPGSKDPSRLSTKDSTEISDRMKSLSTMRETMLKRAKSGQSTQSEFLAWQDAEGQLLKKLSELEKTHPEVAKQLRRLNDMQTLHDDIQEIVELGINQTPEKMDFNRNALAARVAALSSLLGYDIHFGCRSGKDRTGLTDVEIKLLFEVAHREGRVPSYREQEKLPYVHDWRELMIFEGGNRQIVRANLGPYLGLNVGGSFNRPRGENEQRYLNSLYAIVGVQGIFFRP